MRNYLLKISSTSTFKQSLITTISTLTNGGLGALFYIFTARFLGPSNFGFMMIAITTMTLVGDIADLGTNTGSVRFIGKYFLKDREKAFRFLKLGIEIKIFASVVIIILGYFLSPFLAEEVFAKVELTQTLRIAFIGVSTYLLFTFVTSSLQALQKFYKWSFIQISTNLMRLLVVLSLFWFGIFNQNATIFVYIAIPFFGFLIGVFLIPRNFVRVKGELSVAYEFFNYNKWVALFALVSATGSRLDTFISARVLSSHDLGIYSAASQMVSVIPQIVGAIGTVVAPKMAGMGSLDKVINYMKKLQLMVLGIAAFGILSIPIVVFVIPYVFGGEYLASIPVFVILFLGMLVFLISIPVHNAIFYYFSKPQVFFYLAVTHIILVGVLGWNLIGVYGAMGAAITVLVGQVFNFAIPLVWVLKKINLKTHNL